MNAILIGLLSSVLTITLFTFLKRMDKKLIYGLILVAIGFLYVGYTWTDLFTVMISGVQALIFLAFGYRGIKRNIRFLAIGYALHGVWDLLYGQLGDQTLLPPHYDLFCLTYDFIVAFYLWHLNYQEKKAASYLTKDSQ